MAVLSGDFGKKLNFVTVAQRALQHGVVQFHLEILGGADTPDGRYGTAGHDMTFGKRRGTGRPQIALDQVFGGAQRAMLPSW